MKSTIESEQKTISVVIADDQLSIRQSLKSQLESALDIQVIGYADNGLTALEKVAELLPDVIVIDLEMPDMDGITAITQISDLFPQTKCLVFSSHNERKYINRAIIAGAKGYLLKNTSQQDLIEAIRKIHGGYFQLGSGLLDKISLGSSSLNSIDRTERVIWESQLISALETKLTDNIKSLITKQISGDKTIHFEELKQRFQSISTYQAKTDHKLRKIELLLYLLIFWQIVTMIICLSIL